MARCHLVELLFRRNSTSSFCLVTTLYPSQNYC
uniref:Uncharacterized protein n=1 Tax=Anguilla anguilla TaxID=7936 RepID=A0A0E9QZ51_ANGAN